MPVSRIAAPFLEQWKRSSISQFRVSTATWLVRYLQVAYSYKTQAARRQAIMVSYTGGDNESMSMLDIFRCLKRLTNTRINISKQMALAEFLISVCKKTGNIPSIRKLNSSIE